MGRYTITYLIFSFLFSITPLCAQTLDIAYGEINPDDPRDILPDQGVHEACDNNYYSRKPKRSRRKKRNKLTAGNPFQRKQAKRKREQCQSDGTYF